MASIHGVARRQRHVAAVPGASSSNRNADIASSSVRGRPGTQSHTAAHAGCASISSLKGHRTAVGCGANACLHSHVAASLTAQASFECHVTTSSCDTLAGLNGHVAAGASALACSQ